MAITTRSKIPYPNEQADPWYAAFQDMINAIDYNVYAEWEDRNMSVMGGGQFSWNAGAGLLTWTANIECGSAPTGFVWRVLGPASRVILDGEYMWFQAVRAPINNVAVAVFTGSSVPLVGQDGTDCVVLVRRQGNLLYFRNGGTLDDGDSEYVFEEGTGDENFSYKTVVPTKKLIVPVNQQMAVFNGFINTGQVVLLGELVLL